MTKISNHQYYSSYITFDEKKQSTSSVLSTTDHLCSSIDRLSYSDKFCFCLLHIDKVINRRVIR